MRCSDSDRVATEYFTVFFCVQPGPQAALCCTNPWLQDKVSKFTGTEEPESIAHLEAAFMLIVWPCLCDSAARSSRVYSCCCCLTVEIINKVVLL